MTTVVLAVACVLMMVAMLIVDHARSTRAREWWATHSVPLVTDETVTHLETGTETWKMGPYTAWLRADSAHYMVFNNFKAVGCGDGSLAGPGLVHPEDLDAIRALHGRSLAMVHARARVMLAPRAGDDPTPPCPGMTVAAGHWTYQGKTVAFLDPTL